MAVYLTAAAVFAFYLAAIPIKIAAIVEISSGVGFGAGLALFENRFACKRALRRALGKIPHLPWKKFEMDAGKLAMLRALRRGAGYLMRHTCLEQIRLRGVIGTSDAAKTALICGLANAAGNALRPALRRGTVSICLQPDFSQAQMQVRLYGIISLRLGHIMLAAIFTLFQYGNGRIQQWINTRLKTS